MNLASVAQKDGLPPFMRCYQFLPSSDDHLHKIPQRHEQEKDGKDLPKSPLRFTLGLKVTISVQGELDVDNEDNIDHQEECQPNPNWERR